MSVAHGGVRSRPGRAIRTVRPVAAATRCEVDMHFSAAAAWHCGRRPVAATVSPGSAPPILRRGRTTHAGNAVCVGTVTVKTMDYSPSPTGNLTRNESRPGAAAWSSGPNQEEPIRDSAPCPQASRDDGGGPHGPRDVGPPRCPTRTTAMRTRARSSCGDSEWLSVSPRCR